MNIIVDECLHVSTIELLRKLRFRMFNIEDIIRNIVEDEKIVEYAMNHNIPIITHNRRFGRIYFEFSEEPVTIVVVQIVAPHPIGTNRLITEFF